MSGLAYELDLQENATPLLQEITKSLEPRRLNQNVGRSATRKLQMHLQALDQTPNRLGGARTHYYSDQAGATTWTEAGGLGVLVNVGEPNRGLALHFHGGTLDESNLHNARMFTVPARAEAHGKEASDFGDSLVVLYGRNGPYALALAKDTMHVATKGPRKGQLVPGTLKDDSQNRGAGTVMFWLTTKLRFQANPEVLPAEEELQMAVVGDLWELWQRELRAREGTANV